MTVLTRRRLAPALLLLLVAVFAAVIWGPAPLAQSLGDGWSALCSAVAWQQKTVTETNPQPPDPVTTSKVMKVTAGDPAPDVVLRDLDGAEFRLSERRGKRPVVIEFGSYT